MTVDPEELAALEQRVDGLQQELAAVRGEIARLHEARGEQQTTLADLDSRLTVLEGSTREILRHQGAQSAMLTKLGEKVGKGTLVAAGVPSGVAVVVATVIEVLRHLGYLPH